MKTRQIKISELKLPESPVNKLILIGAGIVGIYFFKKWADKQLKLAADKLIAKDGDAGAARLLITAMNPSGVEFLKRVDGTNEELIYSTAAQIKDLNKVQDYYKLQTKGGVLEDDLTKELGTDGYDKFLALATHGKSGSKKYATNRNDIPVNMWVITKAKANIRTTPENNSQHWIHNNVLKTVERGRALGISTGKYVYDQSGDTTYIEFYTLGSKVAGKKFYYVAKSQIEYLTNEQKKQREKAGERFPFEVLAGFKATKTYAVTIRQSLVFDEQGKYIGTVSPGITLGLSLITLDQGKGSFTKIRTIQGLTRWVKTADIHFIQS